MLRVRVEIVQIFLVKYVFGYEYQKLLDSSWSHSEYIYTESAYRE